MCPPFFSLDLFICFDLFRDSKGSLGMILGILRDSWLWFVWLVIFTDCTMGWKSPSETTMSWGMFDIFSKHRTSKSKFGISNSSHDRILSSKSDPANLPQISFHFKRRKDRSPLLGACDMRPENIQMLPRIHIFQGTALNETDLCGISSLDVSGVGHGKASGYEIKHWQN